LARHEVFESITQIFVGWGADEVSPGSDPFSTPFPQTHRAAFTAMGFPASSFSIISIIWGEKSRSSGGMHSVPKCREREQQVHEHVLAGWPQCLRDAVTLFTSF